MKLTARLTTVEKEYKSVIIAFDASDDRLQGLTQQFGNDRVDDLHITLLYLGDTSKYDELDKLSIIDRLQQFAQDQAPVVGKYGGLAHFNPGEHSDFKYPIVLLYDSPQLPIMYRQLQQLFDTDRETSHGFIPHTTLAYVDELPESVQMDEDIRKIYTNISVWWGDEKMSFPLEGIVVEKGGPGSGHHGHSGRPGKRGGSVSGTGGVGSSFLTSDVYKTIRSIADSNVDNPYMVIGSSAIKLYAGDEYKKQPNDVDIVGHVDTSNFESRSDPRQLGDVRVYSDPDTNISIDLLTPGKTVGADVVPGFRSEWTIPKLYSEAGVENFTVVDGIKVLKPELLLPVLFRSNNFEGIQAVIQGLDLSKDFIDTKWYRGEYSETKEFTIEKQLPIDDESKQRLIDIRTKIFFDESDDLALKMFTGDITLGTWEEQFRQLQRELHTSVAAIAKGGWDQMTSADWGRLGPILKEQYNYLHGFSQHIAANRESISLRQIQARARLYGKAGGYSGNIITTPRAILDELPFMPKDGSTSCLVGCKCYWDLTTLSTDGDIKTVEAVWTLTEAEHCLPDSARGTDGCTERSGYTVVFTVHRVVDVPDTVGGY